MMSPIKSSAPENQEKIKELEENIVFFTDEIKKLEINNKVN